jgi:glycosyltransferase involved in cell wall biosynthesis
MKILSFHPGSIYLNGGAGRLMRRLFQEHESQVTAIYVNYNSTLPNKGEVDEISIQGFPLMRDWMRWKLRPIFWWLRERVFFSYTKNKILKYAKNINFDVLHVINHGQFCAVLCEDDFLNNRKLWVSFHDHFSLCSSFEDTKFLWDKADRRLAISNELGLEYQRLFGNLNFELITDGVSADEISKPKETNQSSITIYFTGLLHIDYYPLFEVLANALDVLSDTERKFNLILRGSQKLTFLNNRKFNVEYRTNFVSDNEIKNELDEADILYLPIKFTLPDFYLYSLSTKMIGYLGASGTILYHGPEDSAANQLLQKNQSADSCVSLNVDDMVKSLNKIMKSKNTASTNAKKLAQSQFLLKEIQNKFWNE